MCIVITMRSFVRILCVSISVRLISVSIMNRLSICIVFSVRIVARLISVLLSRMCIVSVIRFVRRRSIHGESNDP
jgi:hypothetical protein